MRQQLDRSLCQLRGHERSERKRESDPRTEEFSSKFVMEGKVEVVEEERDQVKSSGQSRSLSLLLWVLEVHRVIDQDSFSAICRGRTGSPKV